MGNRANVIFADSIGETISPCIYLHWNGGAESIYPFLDELDRRHVRADHNYEAARFIEVVAQFMDHGEKDMYTLSLGVVNGPKSITIKDLNKVATDSEDNGFYIIDRTGTDSKNRRVRKVRRFISLYENEKMTLKEMSQSEVTKEREEAYKHSYNTKSETIAEFFKRITKGKKIQENT